MNPISQKSDNTSNISSDLTPHQQRVKKILQENLPKYGLPTVLNFTSTVETRTGKNSRGHSRLGSPNTAGMVIYLRGLQIYLGELKDGIPHGKGTLLHFSSKVSPDEEIKWSGQYENGKSIGTFDLYQANRLIYQGTCDWATFGNKDEGIRVGLMITNLFIKANTARIEYQNGHFYEGEHENGIAKGRGIYTGIENLKIEYARQYKYMFPWINPDEKNVLKYIHEGIFDDDLIKDGPHTRAYYINDRLVGKFAGTLQNYMLEGPGTFTTREREENVTFYHDRPLGLVGKHNPSLMFEFGRNTMRRKEAQQYHMNQEAIHRRIQKQFEEDEKFAKFMSEVSKQVNEGVAQNDYLNNLDKMLEELDKLSPKKMVPIPKQKNKAQTQPQSSKAPSPAPKEKELSIIASSSSTPPPVDDSPLTGFHPKVTLHERVRRWESITISDIQSIPSYSGLDAKGAKKQRQYHHLPHIHWLLDPKNKNKYFTETPRGYSMLAELESFEDCTPRIEYGYVSIGITKPEKKNPAKGKGKFEKAKEPADTWTSVSAEALQIYHVKFTPSFNAKDFFANPEIKLPEGTTQDHYKEVTEDDLSGLPKVLPGGKIQFIYSKFETPYTLRIHPIQT